MGIFLGILVSISILSFSFLTLLILPSLLEYAPKILLDLWNINIVSYLDDDEHPAKRVKTEAVTESPFEEQKDTAKDTDKDTAKDTGPSKDGDKDNDSGSDSAKSVPDSWYDSADSNKSDDEPLDEFLELAQQGRWTEETDEIMKDIKKMRVDLDNEIRDNKDNYQPEEFERKVQYNKSQFDKIEFILHVAEQNTRR